MTKFTSTEITQELSRRFAERLHPLASKASNELAFETSMELVPGICAQVYRKWNGRLVSLFADDARDTAQVFHLYYVFTVDDAGVFLIFRVPLDANSPEFTSLTNALPAANWQEREVQDMFAIRVEGHPNPRRCALHDDWPDVAPLRKDFDIRTVLPEFSGVRHDFRPVDGEGVFQIPVGPVHAGIIEPGHFLFSVAGEPVLYLQIRLFYTHKGTEKIFENIDLRHAVTLAESISGDSSFAHATAFCHAIERASGAEVPARARAIRTILLELERMYNHTGDIGAIATDVAFVVANAHAARLREQLARNNALLTGSRLLRGMVCPGGVRRDWGASQTQALSECINTFAVEFEDLVNLIQQSSSTRDRLDTTGLLSPKTAQDLGIVGIAGRASGFTKDLRRDFPHAAYQGLAFDVPVFTEGDVTRRLQVRVEEVRQSINIIRQLLARFPSGDTRIKVAPPEAESTALGYVEGWRGEIFHWIRMGSDGKLARCKIKDPSLQNWPALSEAILGNIIPDFPVVNKSFNLSYSGTDR